MADAPLTLKDLAKLDIATIKGVGDKRRESLAEVGIANVLELITTYPRRYVDRTNEAHVGDLVEGVETLVLVKVRSARRVPLRTKRSMVTALVGDATGSLSLTFFNQPWRERQLKTDLEVAVFGKPELFRGKMQMVNPVVDIIGDKTGRIVPIYPQSEKANLSTWELASWVRNALDRAAPRTISDPLPPQIRERLKMIDRHAALNILNFGQLIIVRQNNGVPISSKLSHFLRPCTHTFKLSADQLPTSFCYESAPRVRDYRTTGWLLHLPSCRAPSQRRSRFLWAYRQIAIPIPRPGLPPRPRVVLGDVADVDLAEASQHRHRHDIDHCDQSAPPIRMSTPLRHQTFERLRLSVHQSIRIHRRARQEM